jgi:hypothetical protein
MVHARQKLVYAKQDILMRDQKVIKRDKEGLFFFFLSISCLLIDARQKYPHPQW